MAVAGMFLKLSVCVSVLCACGALTVGPADRPVALVVIDVQNCFVPGGENPVPGGADVIPVINGLRERYGDGLDLVVMSQDWHCADHVSFTSQHPGYSNFEVMELDYDSQGALCTGPSPYAVNCTGSVAHRLNQTLWPDHCVINTTGAEFHPQLTTEPTDLVVQKGYRCEVCAEFHPQLTTEPSDLVVQKGYRCEVDSYSAFFDNGGFRQTELDSLLRQRQVRSLIITGLALDFCVFYTALDGRRLGYDTYVVRDAARGITPAGVERAMAEMEAAGVSVIRAEDVGRVLGVSGSAGLAGPAAVTVLACLTAVLTSY
ncbi:nicotinamidase-like [Branchiostoma floridae]|uniref:nicotinamidase n=1 Tax=Branchiostoma floridae TaxID=7739 RepID=A0A9J7LGX9_BRAFL|nr:nicotinamidase-like [Branchiostoma floridae]